MKLESEAYKPSPLEILTNRFWQLQRLQEEGKNVAPELEETWGEITDIIHGEDEVKIQGVRERIKNIVREQVKQNEP